MNGIDKLKTVCHNTTSITGEHIMTRSTKPHHCKTCGETDPDAFPKRGKSKCKKCTAVYTAKWMADNADRVKDARAKRYAENSDQIKEASRKWAVENADRRRETNKKWRAENANHLKEYKAKRYAENADQIKEMRKKRYVENPEPAKEASRKWQVANPNRRRENNAKWRANNPEIIAKWRAENPEKVNAYAAKRRADELQATPGWELDNTEIGVAKYSKSAELTQSTNAKHHVDHTIPLAGVLVCGLHTDANLRVIPAIENLQKHNKFDVAKYNDLPEILPEEAEWFDFFLQEKKHHDELLAELKS